MLHSCFISLSSLPPACLILTQVCRKLLTRNIFAPQETAGTSGQQNRADILNLISSDALALSRIGVRVVILFCTQIEMAVGCSYIWFLLGQQIHRQRLLMADMLIGPSGLWGLATLILTCPPAYLITKLEYKLFEKRLSVKDEKITLMQEAIQAIPMIKMMAAEKFWFRRIKKVRDQEFTRLIQARLLGFISALL